MQSTRWRPGSTQRFRVFIIGPTAHGSYQLPPAVLIGHRDKGRPWCYAGNGTRTFTPDAGTEQRPKKAVTGKPDDIERVTSGLAGGRRERSRKTTSPAAYPTTSARTSSETVGGDDELHRVYKIHRFVVKDLRGKSPRIRSAVARSSWGIEVFEIHRDKKNIVRSNKSTLRSAR